MEIKNGREGKGKRKPKTKIIVQSPIINIRPAVTRFEDDLQVKISSVERDSIKPRAQSAPPKAMLFTRTIQNTSNQENFRITRI